MQPGQRATARIAGQKCPDRHWLYEHPWRAGGGCVSGKGVARASAGPPDASCGVLGGKAGVSTAGFCAELFSNKGILPQA